MRACFQEIRKETCLNQRQLREVLRYSCYAVSQIKIFVFYCHLTQNLPFLVLGYSMMPSQTRMSQHSAAQTFNFGSLLIQH